MGETARFDSRCVRTDKFEQEEKNAGDENNLEMRWTDPRSGITYVVDRRTGNTYPANAEYGNASADMRPHTRRTLPATPLATQVPSETAVETPAWIKQALEVCFLSQNNPLGFIFSRSGQ